VGVNVSANKSPVIWKDDNAKLLNSNGLEFNNGITFGTYLTATLAKAATPIGPELCYIVDKSGIYLYCDSCSFPADDDMVLTTGNGGTTRWELHQKVTRAIGDTGWISTNSAVISKVNATTVRLTTPNIAAISIKSKRIPVPVANYDLVITGAAGIKFVYFDESSLVLKKRDTLWDFDTEVPVMIVYWSGTAIVGGIQTELHGIRDNIWHKYTHEYIGLQYRSGLSFTGSVQTDNNVDPGASESVYNLWSTTGEVQDEDARATPGLGQWIQTLGSGLLTTNAAIFGHFYFNGTIITTNAAMADRAPFIHAGANTPPRWESAGTLTASITGDYIVYHYFVTPMIDGWSVFARPHNAKFTSLATALSATPTQLTWSNYAEIKHIYTAIFRVNTGWAMSHRCKLVSLRDYRTVAGTPVAAINPTAHSSLTGLELAGPGVTYGHVDDAGVALGSSIANATAKSTPTVLDSIPICDQAAGNVLKKVALGDLKTFIMSKEYASNSNATNTATDTTSFVNGTSGKDGSNIPNGAVGTAYNRRVRFLTAIQPTDMLVLEFYDSTNSSWTPSGTRFPYIPVASNSYGMRLSSFSSTDVDVTFGAGGLHMLGAATYGANSSEAWSLITSWKWRVTKISFKD
jgi:hypothetical protein